MKLNKQPLSFFSICRLHAMLLCLYKGNGRGKSLKTDEADEIFNVTGNKTNSITDIFFLKYYLDWGYCNCTPGNFFLKIS